jgi:hypothetical protein
MLRKYIEGTATEPESNEIEKLSLESPLFEEAIEGLRQLPNSELDEHLNDLERRINEMSNTKDQKIPLLKYIGIAASIVILIGLAFLFLPESNKSSEQLAINAQDEKTKSNNEEEVLGTSEEIKEASEEIVEDRPIKITIDAAIPMYFSKGIF